APRSEVERVLAEVFASVLGVGRVGVHDDFFALGGDSILSIQVVSRSRRDGVVVSSRDVFARSSVAALAEVARVEGARVAPVGPVSGPVVGTPITEWFFATHPVAPDHFTMAVMLDLVERVQAGVLERALRALAVQHDMLRLRADEGGLRVLGVGEARFDLAVVDLGEVEPGDRERVVRERTEAEQASLSLSEGPVVRAVLFRQEGVDRLLLTAHHLVVDGVSWRVLLEDLGTAYRRSVEGGEVDLGSRSTPFPVWAERLARHTAEGGFDD
ncbi:condensation domain-containing protein, partial [Nocardiopsis listeri]|uniref:condensation domain-containing protein n=1 Tax=Nocardiopsis listeri TaxID=53440 RepID=UPI000AD644A5